MQMQIQQYFGEGESRERERERAREREICLPAVLGTLVSREFLGIICY